MYEAIINKLNNNIECELSINELKYIYEDNFKEFESIRNLRNNYNDLCKLFGKKHVACTLEEINHDTICYVGNLYIDKKLPTYNLKYIYGDLDYRLSEVYNLENLEIIVGNAYFPSIYDVDGLENLSIIVGDGIFKYLDNVEGLISLTRVYRDLDLNYIKNSNGLNNLKFIGHNAHFVNLTETICLDNLEKIGGNAYFCSLESAKGLEKLKKIRGNAYFESLKSIEYLYHNLYIGKKQCFGQDGLSLEEFRNKEKEKCMKK